MDTQWEYSSNLIVCGLFQTAADVGHRGGTHIRRRKFRLLVYCTLLALLGVRMSW
jgi:hypothetical protein